MEEIETKKCSKCWSIKPITEFYKNRCSPDGLQWWCKSCSRTVYRIRKAGNLTQPALPLHDDSVGADNNQPFAQMPQSEIIEGIRERINFLRGNGWVFEGKLTFIQKKEVVL